MIPKLTRYGARVTAVLVLALGAAVAVLAATDRPADENPGSAAAERQADAQDAYEAARSHHLDYIEGKYGTPCDAWAFSESEGCC